VITWFQNRRAKFKRDMEELRKDVEKTSSGDVASPGGAGGEHGFHPQLQAGGHLPQLLAPGLPLMAGLCLAAGVAAPHLAMAGNKFDLVAGAAAAHARNQPISSPGSVSPPIRVEDSD